MIANRYLFFKNYTHSIKYQPVPGKALFSLRNVKKITYEHKTKILQLYYFQESFPESIQNVEESTYDQIATALAQQPDLSPPPFEGNPHNQF